jgi:hypothetical protein
MMSTFMLLAWQSAEPGYCSGSLSANNVSFFALVPKQRNFCEKDVKDWIRAMCFLSFQLFVESEIEAEQIV